MTNVPACRGAGGVDNGGGHAQVGREGIRNISAPSTQICCEPKISLFLKRCKREVNENKECSPHHLLQFQFPETVNMKFLYCCYFFPIIF